MRREAENVFLASSEVKCLAVHCQLVQSEDIRMRQSTGIDEAVIMAGTVYLHTFATSEEVAEEGCTVSFDVVGCTILLLRAERIDAFHIVSLQSRFVNAILLPVDTLSRRKMIIDPDIEG